MNKPKPDDFRLDRQDGQLVVTFTPDGSRYAFSLDDGQVSEPGVSPARADSPDYAVDDVRRMAVELAQLATKTPARG